MTDRAQRTDPPAAPDAVYYFVQRVLRAAVGLLIHFEVEGQERMPTSGSFLMTANHLAMLDAVIGCIVVPVRMVAFGADKWRRSTFFRFVLELMGVIWITRGEADMDAIKAALGVFKRGGRMGVAPEGTRSLTGQLQRGKPGAAFLADRARIPVVPVAMTGTETIVSSWKRLRRPRVRCVIGVPYRLPGSGRAKGAELDELTDLVMCKIAALLPHDYRGVYADHPLLLSLLAAEPRPAGIAQHPGAAVAAEVESAQHPAASGLEAAEPRSAGIAQHPATDGSDASSGIPS